MGDFFSYPCNTQWSTAMVGQYSENDSLSPLFLKNEKQDEWGGIIKGEITVPMTPNIFCALFWSHSSPLIKLVLVPVPLQKDRPLLLKEPR
uniref:Uncharacterized protein n=1 Tax=Octopus bimaculoides TaxID=37653 RepID=A0A0L8GXJ3_OCTBM